MEPSAIFSFSLTPLQRRRQRNYVQLAAYVTGQRLRARDGRSFWRKSSESIIAWKLHGSTRDLEEFANLTESAERRCDALVGRHVVVALPRGLPGETLMRMAEGLAETIRQTCGVPVVLAVHHEAKPDRDLNPHAHLLFGGRPFDDLTGTFSRRRFRPLDAARTGGPIIESFRKRWEEIVNSHLPPLTQKVSRLSHVRRGITRIPKMHLGPSASAAERRGIRTVKGDFNRLVDTIAQLDADIAKLDAARLEALSEEAALPLSPIRTNVLRSETVDAKQVEGRTNRASENLLSDDLGLEPLDRKTLIEALPSSQCVPHQRPLGDQADRPLP